MKRNEGAEKFLTGTIWIYVAMFVVQAVIYRHRESLLFWTCAGAFALLLAPATYFTVRRMMGR
jgi:hypothetical protein